MIKVSVIMSEYNTRESYLVNSIQSILDQTFKEFEFIIIDDCGKNNLKEITDRFNDPRLVIIKNPKNMGLVYSLNHALRRARGKYVVRMDTDDIAKPDRIETIYAFIESHKEFSVVGSLVNEFSEEGTLGVLGDSGEKLAKNVMLGDSMIHPTVIMDKNTILSIGGYDNYNRAEDLALWCKLILNGQRLYVMDKILLDYRVNNNDYSKRKLKHRKGEILARLHYYPKLHAGPKEYFKIVKSIISGLVPSSFARYYRKHFILKSEER